MIKIYPKTRNSNTELLRIIAMFLIVISHISAHGLHFIGEDIADTFQKRVVQSFINFGAIGNCIFMLISGYFLCGTEFKLKKVKSLYIKLFVYSATMGVLAYLLKVKVFGGGYSQYLTSNYQQFFVTRDIKHLIKSFIPFISMQNWYITLYIIFYCLSPFCNKLVLGMSKKEHLLLIGILVTLNGIFPNLLCFDYVRYSNSLALFFTYFFIGVYIKKYEPEVLKKQTLLILLTLVFFVFLLLSRNIIYVFGIACPVIRNNQTRILSLFEGMDRIFTFCLVIAVFSIFRNINIGSNKIINFISASTLSIYLIHENPNVKYYIWNDIFHCYDLRDSDFLLSSVVWIGIIVFCACTVIYFFEYLTVRALRKLKSKNEKTSRSI